MLDLSETSIGKYLADLSNVVSVDSLSVVGGGAVFTPWYRAGGAPMPIAAYQPLGAASYAASKINLANPGVHDAGNGIAYPAWNVGNGWMFDNSVNQYLTTNIVPGSNWSMLVQLSNVSLGVISQGNSGIVGISDYWFTSFGILIQSGYSVQFYNGAYGSVESVTLNQYDHGGSGNLGIGNHHGYNDGHICTTTALDDNCTTSYPFLIGAASTGQSGGVYDYFNGNISSLAIYNAPLTDAQFLAVATAMAALPL